MTVITPGGPPGEVRLSIAVRTAASPGSGACEEAVPADAAPDDAAGLEELPHPAATKATVGARAERVAIVRVVRMNSSNPHVVG
jgi:hypothetical protein